MKMNNAPLPVRAFLSEERSRPDASLFRRNAALCNPDRDYRSVENADSPLSDASLRDADHHRNIFFSTERFIPTE
ncbi:MAG: hypothetical protein LBS03_03890 [Bacteroidales bacterium]|nr:hypothetical protein [Bacteroidales bacterium]